MYVDDAVEGMLRIMSGPKNHGPLNLGSDKWVTINELAFTIGQIAGLPALDLKYVEGPTGPHSRNSDNTKISECLGWAPDISLRGGLEATYRWIASQVEMELA
jgi:nucleoside-diphosphate-sugar epimerase